MSKGDVQSIKSVPTYPKERELTDRMLILIHEYNGEISYPAVVGVLALVSDEIIRDANET